jgi:predicted RNA-binding protein YlqC (UPF0109 family)
MRYFLELVLGRLVTHPEEIDVEETAEEQGTLFRIRVNPEDLGRIIGRNGRTIEAIRSLMNAASRDGRTIFVEVEDGEFDGDNT